MVIGASSASRLLRSRSRFWAWRCVLRSLIALIEAIVSEKDGELEECSLKLRHPPSGLGVRCSLAMSPAEEISTDGKEHTAKRHDRRMVSWYDAEDEREADERDGQREPLEVQVTCGCDLDGAAWSLALDPCHLTHPS